MPMAGGSSQHGDRQRQQQVRRLARQKSAPAAHALLRHARRHAGAARPVQPVEQPDVVRERQRRHQRPIVTLGAHKGPPALERRLPQHAVGVDVGVVMFDIVMGMVKQHVAHAPAVGIQPQWDAHQGVQPAVGPGPTEKRVMRGVVHHVHRQEHADKDKAEITGEKRPAVLLLQAQPVTQAAQRQQQRHLHQHAAVGEAVIAVGRQIMLGGLHQRAM